VSPWFVAQKFVIDLPFIDSFKLDLQLHQQISEKLRSLTSLQQQSEKLTQDLSQERDALLEAKTILEQELAQLMERRNRLTQSYPTLPPGQVLKERQEKWKAQVHRHQLLQENMRKQELLLSEVRSNQGRIQDQMKQLQLMFTDQLSRLQTLRPIHLDLEDALMVFDPLLTTVTSEIKELEQRLNEKSTQKGIVLKQIEDDKERQIQRKFLEQRYREVESKVLRTKRLLDVLGQDDLRSFVLSLVERALIEQTNHELTKLINGRYQILHAPKKGKLTPEFSIVDYWRDGLVRKVSTLSGGETFMVSLAMALALAEMTRGKADIECFFIDEGFGTLDEESLDEVLEMLQQVRSGGKQIGVITHVKSLSARLPQNLRVQKDSRGNSHTQIIWN
jgi:exonuclease SbcC